MASPNRFRRNRQPRPNLGVYKPPNTSLIRVDFNGDVELTFTFDAPIQLGTSPTAAGLAGLLLLSDIGMGGIPNPDTWAIGTANNQLVISYDDVFNGKYAITMQPAYAGIGSQIHFIGGEPIPNSTFYFN